MHAVRMGARVGIVQPHHYPNTPSRYTPTEGGLSGDYTLGQVAEQGAGKQAGGHSPEELSDRLSLKHSSSPEGGRLPQRSSSRESNSHASGQPAPLKETHSSSS